jgi:hypothetical protein
MQVPDVFRKCVVFLGYRKEHQGDTSLHLCGTAFLVSVPLPGCAYSAGYLMTARHVLQKIKDRAIDGKAIVRCNRTSGGAVEVETDLSNWREHEQSTADVAAMRVHLPVQEWDHRFLLSGIAITSEVLEREGISFGDEVFLIGLFVRHSWEHRNIPIVRVGNIACMPEEPVKTKDFGYVDAYLVEARSIGGLSGSPVLIAIPNVRQVGKKIEIGRMATYYLLGLMHGHWDMPTVATDVIEEEEKVNTGIAVVVPCDKIMELLNCQEFADERNRMAEALAAAKLPTADGEPLGWNWGLVKDSE